MPYWTYGGGGEVSLSFDENAQNLWLYKTTAQTDTSVSS